MIAQLRRPARHRAAVLQDERPAAAAQRARHALDRDIARRAFDVRCGAQHLALARPVEIAVELLVDGQAAERRVVGRLRRQLHFERSGGVRHAAYARNLYIACSIGTPRTSIRLKSVVPTPCASASCRMLSHFWNGAVPRVARGL